MELCTPGPLMRCGDGAMRRASIGAAHRVCLQCFHSWSSLRPFTEDQMTRSEMGETITRRAKDWACLGSRPCCPAPRPARAGGSPVRFTCSVLLFGCMASVKVLHERLDDALSVAVLLLRPLLAPARGGRLVRVWAVAGDRLGFWGVRRGLVRGRG